MSEMWDSVAPGWEVNAGFVDEQLALATDALLDAAGIGPSHLARRLRDLGVPVAPARPSALAALAHRIPAPVLADLLGFGAQMICKAGADLKVDYASYVARRT